ncbi:DUF1002 domain-containing protein [Streptococcus dysgalactiae]|uniref:DUF1002 domain-containing protein n=1 Tax=Streptococcus dysgalactiae TaxID=1334 RepID=UPI0010CAD0C5|nr:DUF1002 domain-containing protein [Streptococcus dysgalactiae]MEC4576666.1 DUF1002 domain-containing protein [Streptococcus dysgalactiae]VTT01582.1 extracellular protein [Streptococcus dysgalactiae]
MTYKKPLVAGALVLASVFTIQTAFAATTNVQTVIDEHYVQPDYVLGYSLSPDQQNQTLSLLHYNSAKDKQIKTLNTTAYASIMNVADDPSLQLYSSVKIQKLGAKETLTVTIETPQTIQKVTQDMYRNAAVTLGIEHASIQVASPIPVTGESALAGIYYSLEKNGAKVPEENKQLAQEELATLSSINADNAGKAGYDADKLNVALTDIKAAVAEGGKNLSEDRVRQIVEDTLKNYGLNQSVTADQINVIVNFAIHLSNSGVITNGQFVETLNDLKASIVSKANGTFDHIDLHFDANQALDKGKSIWQQIVDFFKQFING